MKKTSQKDLKFYSIKYQNFKVSFTNYNWNIGIYFYINYHFAGGVCGIEW